MRTGLLIICFNRPFHTEKVFKSVLESTFNLNQINIFISIDGPKNKADNLKIKKIVKLANLYFEEFNNYSLTCRKKNLGLKKNVLSSIDNCFKTVDNLIILEDDICINKNAIETTIFLLNKFSKSNIIGNINLYNDKITSDKYKSYEINGISYKIDKSFSCWGWATWKNKWRSPNFSILDLKKLNLLDRLSFNHFGRANHLAHLYSNIIGERSTWAILRKFDILVNLKLKSITLIHSHSRNIGFDNSGTHIINYNIRDKSLYKIIQYFKAIFIAVLPPLWGLKIISITSNCRKKIG